MNVKALVALFQLMLDEGWKKHSTQEYLQIPENQINFYNLKITNLKLSTSVTADVGLLIRQHLEDGELKEVYAVEEIGDLQFKQGFDVLNAENEKLSGTLQLGQLANFKLKGLGLEFKEGVKAS